MAHSPGRRPAIALLSLIVFLTACFGGIAPALSAPDVNAQTKALVVQIRSRVNDLRQIEQNHDPSVKRIADAMDTLTTKLEGMTFVHGGTGGTGADGATAYLSKTDGTQIYVTDRFFNGSQHFGAVQGDVLAVQQMAILLHEAVHSDQNLQYKTLGLVKSVFGTGDQAEAEAYAIEYIMLRALGGSPDMVEIGNVRDKLVQNKVLVTDSADSLERFEAQLGVLGGLAALDGGPQRALQRLNTIKSSLPQAGIGQFFRLNFRLLDDQGKPVVGYWPVNLRVIRTSMYAGMRHLQTTYAGTNGFTTSYMNWLDLIREFPLDSVFELYMQNANGTMLSLTSFTGEALWSKARAQDRAGYWSINLGSKSIASMTGSARTNARSSLRLNTVGPNGPVPANRITVGFGTRTQLTREEDKVIQRPTGYTGLLATYVSAIIDSVSSEIRRFSVADSADVTMDFTPMPPLAQGPLVTSGMTEQQKDARLTALINTADAAFGQALSGGGEVTGVSSYTLDEYWQNVLRLDGLNSLFYGSPARKSSWDAMLKRQQDEAFARMQSNLSYLRTKIQAKQSIENALSSKGIDPRDFVVSSPDSRGTYWFSGNTIDSMNQTIATAKREADAAIAAYADYVAQMNQYFGDAELWKAYARYRDALFFVPSDRTAGMPAYGDTTLAGAVDTALLIERSQYLEEMTQGRDIIIGNLVRERNRILQAEADRLAAEVDAASQAAWGIDSALSKAAAALPKLEADHSIFEKYNPSAIIENYIDVNSRLKGYIDWRAGQAKADLAWGTNYTVTLLHDDLNALLRIIPGLAQSVGGTASGVEAALGDTSYEEWSLKARLTALVQSTAVIKNLNDRVIKHHVDAQQVDAWLLLASNGSASQQARRAELGTRFVKATEYYPYPNGDLFTQAMAELPGRVERVSGTKPGTTATTPPAEQPIVLSVNNRAVTSDVPPKIIQSRTMVPIRFVAQALDATVDWRADDRTVLITSPGKQVVQVPRGSGALRVVVDGREVVGDVPPVLLEGRTMVPVRFVAEAMGADVAWDGQTRTVSITTKSSTTTSTTTTTTTTPSTPAPSTTTQTSGDSVSTVEWDEWAVRAGMFGAADEKSQKETLWSVSGESLVYTAGGNGFYANDFVATRKDYDVSDVLVSFEATGSFRTAQGYVGPSIVFAQPSSMASMVPTNAIGVGAWYSWESGKQDNGMLVFNYKELKNQAYRFIDYGDSAYRQYSFRIKDGKMTVTTPEGTITADVPDARPGLRLPLLFAMRQYDSGKPYSVTIRNLRIVEKP